MLSIGSKVQSGNLGDQDSSSSLQSGQVSKIEVVVVPIGKKNIVMENLIVVEGIHLLSLSRL